MSLIVVQIVNIPVFSILDINKQKIN